MKKTVDQTHIRSINQRVILDRIYEDEPISRAELARELRISKSAMTENITSLLSMGIVQEFGAGVSMSSGGRKPILLKFNGDFKHIIAIELNFEDPIFVLANLSGKILERFTVSISPDAPYEDRLSVVLDSLSQILKRRQLSEKELSIIAISCPGIYHSETRTFFATSGFANWNMGDLSQQIEDRFHTTVLVANDVNAAALGEYTYGAGKKSKDLVYISGGLGLGAGIILNGKLYEGSTRSAGEISNEITVDNSMLDARSFRFKNLGDITTIHALSDRIRREAPIETVKGFSSMGKTMDTFGFKDIVKVWKTEDPFIKQCVEDIGIVIGGSISNIVSLLNCDQIILGGEYTAFNQQILPLINRIVKENAFSPVEVLSAQLEKDSGIYGLFALSREKVFDMLCRMDPENY